MDKIKSVDDFTRFLDKNRVLIDKIVIDISDLPKDDEWINDEEWDLVYVSEKLRNEKED